MISSKNYWLASAAVLTSVVGAQAADLPFRKAAPVEYVRVCDAFGEGFFYIPGTDTCLRINGQVRAEYTIRGGAPTNNPASYAFNQAGQTYRRDLTSFRARGYINADARTQTAYGTLRTFVSYRLTNDTTASGPFGGRGDTVAGIPARVSTGSFQGLDPNATQSSLDKGFIQFAGLTAGRAQSFFDFDAQSYELLSNTVANSNQVIDLFAYTATFGGGFSATISAENSTERSIGDNGLFVFNANSNPVPAGTAAGNINTPQFVTLRGVAGTPQAGILAYAGETIPDIVGNVRYDASWGSAQLSGAYHNIKSLPVSLSTNAAGALVAPGTGRVVAPSADGFAVLGGVKILLPMLAKGDSLTLQGSYEQGAMDYVNPINYLPNGITNVYDTSINANGSKGLQNQFGIPVNDAFVLPNGRIALNHAVGAYAAFRHYFVPAVYGSLFGAYLNITNPPAAQVLGASTDSARIFQIGANLVWSPVKDFQIGGEILYTDLAYRGLATTTANNIAPAAVNLTPQNPSDVRGRLSIRRSF